MGKAVKGNGRPINPEEGQLWFEPVSGTMREWDGEKWAERTTKQIGDKIRKRRESYAKR